MGHPLCCCSSGKEDPGKLNHVRGDTFTMMKEVGRESCHTW
jgi:hypothetical protein